VENKNRWNRCRISSSRHTAGCYTSRSNCWPKRIISHTHIYEQNFF
jgi:hypothetical protein